jgi:hypothetical protein
MPAGMPQRDNNRTLCGALFARNGRPGTPAGAARVCVRIAYSKIARSTLLKISRL